MTDNLRIWKQVEKTDPAHTKKVTQRGGFTAISAAYQIMRATEVFGPIGEGWGYDAETPIFHDALVIVPVTLWHSGDRNKVYGPMYGGAEWQDKKNGRLDSDAVKKATTDALTKLLSQLGFNADVFLGRFDDTKYVDEMREEFKPAPPTSPAADHAIAQMSRCKTPDEFKGFWEPNKDGLKATLPEHEWRRVLKAKDADVARLTAAKSETPFDQREAA